MKKYSNEKKREQKGEPAAPVTNGEHENKYESPLASFTIVKNKEVLSGTVL